MNPQAPEDARRGSAMPSWDMARRLAQIHDIIRSRYPEVDRLAVALYDAQTDLLKTFVDSTLGGTALQAYEARLSDVPSLLALKHSREPRVIARLQDVPHSGAAHALWLSQEGFASSCTVPLFKGQDFIGFLFFDSRRADVFQPAMVSFLTLFADLAVRAYLVEIHAFNTLVGAVRIAADFARIRDPETGAHLERISQLSRLIARGVAQRFSLTDEFVEYVFLFARLHDIGKIGIPDHILLKPARLTALEMEVMKNHVGIGIAMVDRIIGDMSEDHPLAFNMMRNIVAAHHERGDGSGYPRGLFMADIPVEARIVAVADVYDALAHVRPYKRVWTEHEITAEFRLQVASGKLDADCVAALMGSRDERLHILQQFADSPPIT